MRHWKKGLLAAVLCAAVLLGIAVPASGASGTVYLMAVNERVLDTTAENMPTVMGGVLYVPYTMLSIRDSGISLGVSAMYSSARQTVLVSNGQIGIVFDTQNNTAQDLQDNPVPARAMVRNSMVFLPIDYLCAYFGTINCSRVRTNYGIVIRVTNGAVVLSNADFVDSASSQLADNLRRYQASIATPPPAATVPPPTAAPLPSAAATVPPTVSPSGEPSEPSTPPIQAEVLPAFRWGEEGEGIARLLEGRGERALFLFTCEQLRAWDDAVRRLTAAGHTVGLALTGEDAEACGAELEEGRRLLAEIARYHMLVVSGGALDGGDLEGCAVWSADLYGADYRSGAALVEALSPQQANYIELECDVQFLQGLLAAIDGEGCSLRQATAPLLP